MCGRRVHSLFGFFLSEDKVYILLTLSMLSS